MFRQKVVVRAMTLVAHATGEHGVQLDDEEEVDPGPRESLETEEPTGRFIQPPSSLPSNNNNNNGRASVSSPSAANS